MRSFGLIFIAAQFMALNAEDLRRDVRQQDDRRPIEENIYVNPQPGYYGPQYYNYNPFPDDAEQNRIYEENLNN